MQSNNKNLNDKLNCDLKSFIDKYLEVNLIKVISHLTKNNYDNIPLLAEQIKLYKKAKVKLPTFANAYCFFTTKSFEQASSEKLANYKSTLLKGNNLLDLSGGLGVDDWAFSKSFSKIISIDKDEILNQIVRKNFEKLNIKNVLRIDADAMQFIKANTFYDAIYLDADRRPEAKNKRVLSLSISEPNILQIKNRLFQISETVLLKLSPMLDISAIIDELKNVAEVYVVSLNNEVKELLVVLKKSFSQPIIHAVNITDNGIQKFNASYNQTINLQLSDSGIFFYEPSSCLIKSGISKVYANKYGLNMLAQNSYFFLSDKAVNNFFGRSFKVISKNIFSKKKVKKYLVDCGIKKANISKRNFPIAVDELKKIFLINDGGEDYLFFSQNEAKQKLVFHCKKINVKNINT